MWCCNIWNRKCQSKVVPNDKVRYLAHKLGTQKIRPRLDSFNCPNPSITGEPPWRYGSMGPCTPPELDGIDEAAVQSPIDTLVRVSIEVTFGGSLCDMNCVRNLFYVSDIRWMSSLECSELQHRKCTTDTGQSHSEYWLAKSYPKEMCKWDLWYR